MAGHSYPRLVPERRQWSRLAGRAPGYVLVLLAALALGPALAACNTIEGAGEDASAAGRGVSGAARETKEAL